MNVLIACEFSGVVRRAFCKRGHNAVSCDLLPAEDYRGARPMMGSHIRHDVRDVMDERLSFGPWDLIIAFPPCTALAVSGARWFPQKREDGSQQEVINFFMEFANHSAPHIAIENPVGIMSTIHRKPDQIIQPWEYGHPESKRTCLWLKGLPALEPTNILEKPESGVWDNQTPTGQNKLGPSPTRAKDRSRTYKGIAEAMAEQWGQESDR